MTSRICDNSAVSASSQKERSHKGTRIVQADSGSDSDYESRDKNEKIIPVNRLTRTAPTRRRLPPLYAPALLNKGHSLRQSAQRMSFV